MNNHVYIGLGSNLNQPDLQIKKALCYLANTHALDLLDCSSYYLTAPVGYDEQPYFLNAVIRVQTRFKPHVLLRLLQSIENKQHRKRTANQNAARTLDLDMLLYGKLICSTEKLLIPHPRILTRRFVLDPLLEIAPRIIIPGHGRAADYIADVADQDCQRMQRILL